MIRTMSLLFSILVLLSGLLEAQGAFKVIVTASSPVSSITKNELSRLFLKKKSEWADGQEVQLVDQAANSSVRASFSQAIHGKKVSAVKSYWQQMIFSGRGVPPREVASDATVLEFVKLTPNAIGYVSSKSSVNGVKVLRIE